MLVAELKERIDRALASITPAANARAAIDRRADRRRQRRRIVLVPATLLVTATIVAGLTYAFRTNPGPIRDDSAREAPQAGTRVFFAWINQLTVVDVSAGTSQTVHVPELAAGDPPYFIARRGDDLVFWGYSTYALDAADPTADPVTLADDSWYFVPSARPDRVWVVIRDEAESTPQHYVFSGVREITTEREITAEGPAMGDAWMDGAVDAGVVFESRDGLVVWDPIEREVIRRFGTGPMAASHGNTVVWCGDWCRELHFTDVLTGADRTVQPPDGFDRFDGWGGEFTPDGRLFAVPVGNPARNEGPGAVALFDVAVGVVEIIQGSEQERGVPTISWDPSGTRLFIAAATKQGHELRYFDVATEHIQVAPVSLPDNFFAMAAA